MKTSKLFVLAVLFGSSVVLMVQAAQTPETLPRSPSAALPVDTLLDSSLQRAALLQGITQVGGVTPVSAGANAAVGALGISQPHGFAVLERGEMAAVAASLLGNGRVVAFGHTDLFMNVGFANASSARLLENAARWVAPSKAAPRILVLDNEALATFFEQRGFASSNLVSSVAQQQLSDSDVVALHAYTSLTTAEVRALENFAENGGGLLVAGQAWSWLHYQARGKPIQEMPGNRLLAKSGLSFTDPITPSAGFSVATDDALSHGIYAFNYLASLPRPLPKTVDQAEQIRIARALRTVRSVTPLLLAPSALRSALEQLETQGRSIVPTETAPFEPAAQPFLTLGIMRLAARNANADELDAHPAASDFPGMVPASAPRITRSISINSAIPRLHSTGLYAPPGTLVTVTVPDNAIASGLRVQVGAHSDTLWQESRWTRMPQLTRTFALDQPSVRIANEFGGPLYVVVPSQARLGEVRLSFAGAVAAPHFVRGVTTAEQWAMMRNLRAPWAELQGQHVILTVESRLVADMADPGPLLKFWDDVLLMQQTLAPQGDDEARTPMRAVFDRQIAGPGELHAGYPVMGKIANRDIRMQYEADYLTLTGPSGLQRNPWKGWGLAHELGHNLQRAEWTWSGAVEVSNNILGMYALAGVTHQPKEQTWQDGNVFHLSPANQVAQICNYLNPPRTTPRRTWEDWKANPVLGLTMHTQLIDALGWSSMKAVFESFLSQPLTGELSDEQKHDAWMTRYSMAVNRNLAPYFTTWKMPTSVRARSQVSTLPPFTWSAPCS